MPGFTKVLLAQFTWVNQGGKGMESHGCVSMEAEHFTRKHDRGGAAWEVIKGLGRSGDSVAVLPPTVASRTEPDDGAERVFALFPGWVFPLDRIAPLLLSYESFSGHGVARALL